MLVGGRSRQSLQLNGFSAARLFFELYLEKGEFSRGSMLVVDACHLILCSPCFGQLNHLSEENVC